MFVGEPYIIGWVLVGFMVLGDRLRWFYVSAGVCCEEGPGSFRSGEEKSVCAGAFFQLGLPGLTLPP